jgi:hypothetical protein
MLGQQVAQGLASLGRGKDTMLMHVTPNEVAGLQSLAMAHGGSLTINPETGLPEAGFFDDILGAVAPIALGAFLGPAGLGMSALGAGIATGAIGYLASGDIMTGLTSGLGGYGGGNLGSSLASNVPPTSIVPEVVKPSMSALPGTTGASMFTEGAANAAGSAAGNVAGNAAAGASSRFIPSHLVSSPATTSMAANTIGDTAINAATDSISTAIPKVASFGDKINTMGKGALNAIKDPMAFFGKEGPGTLMDGLTLASPLMAIQPEMPEMVKDDGYQMKYEGPYTAQDRKPRTPTEEEMAQLAAAGSPEYSYFGDTNPYPGFNKARGYSQGGVATLYSNSDGTQAQNTLDENYGIGRLNRLAQSSANSSASQYSFVGGGEIPYMGGAPSYGVVPTDLSAVAAIPTTPGSQTSSANKISSVLDNAITDPMGRPTGNPQGGMGGKGGYQGMGGYQNANGGMNGMGRIGGMGGSKGGLARKLNLPKASATTMQDYITAATRTYDPNAAMAAAMDPSGIEQAHFTNINPQAVPKKAIGGGLKNGGFVVPADVVSHLGNGSTDAGLAALRKRFSAQPIRGAGDGMSDSIKTTIEGRFPARIADGEAYIAPEQVKRSGGAKKLYAMMDKVRKARTGNKKQGKQINPNKYMTA